MSESLERAKPSVASDGNGLIDGHGTRSGSQTRRAERLTKITSAIADAVTGEQVFTALVDDVAAALEASTAGLWMVDEDRRTLRLMRALGYRDDAIQSIKHVSIDAEPSFPALDSVRTCEPFWIASQAELLERYPHLASSVTLGRTYRIACLPLCVQGRALGSLALTFEGGSTTLDEDQQSFLLLVARYAGQAVERLRLFDAERKSRSHAEASVARLGILSRASRAFAEAGADLGVLLQRVVDEVTRENADACAMTLIASDGESFDLSALSLRDAEASQSLRSRLESKPPSIGNEKSLIVVPLRVRGKVIGTLNALRRGDKAFTTDDLQLIEELAERASLAIETTRLHHDGQEARERAELLYDLASALIEAACIDDVFTAALDAIKRALGTERSAVLAFDPDGVMRFKAWRGLSDGYRRAVEGHSPWKRDAHDPQPIFISDVADDASLSAFGNVFREEQISALGFIPLVAAGHLLGKFMVYYGVRRTLSTQEIVLSRAIANHVAVSMARFSAVERLQQTVRFNEMFTAILGHDLRNPLGAIMTSAQLALKRGDNEKILKPLARILNSGERMARMIDQLLDFTRVRVGEGIPLELKQIDLVPLLRQVMDELDDANPEWKLQLEIVGDTEGVWDEDRLSQVFSNLVGNGIQHGLAEHGVRVRVDGTKEDAVRIDVHNMGTIPVDVIPKLFEPMTGGKQRRDRSHGLGLGLFISQRIAEAHRGSIEVRSSAADGTIFIVSLPRTRPAQR